MMRAHRLAMDLCVGPILCVSVSLAVCVCVCASWLAGPAQSDAGSQGRGRAGQFHHAGSGPGPGRGGASLARYKALCDIYWPATNELERAAGLLAWRAAPAAPTSHFIRAPIWGQAACKWAWCWARECAVYMRARARALAPARAQ